MVPRKVVRHIVFYHVEFVEYKGTKMYLIVSFLKPCTIELLSRNPHFLYLLMNLLQMYKLTHVCRYI